MIKKICSALSTILLAVLALIAAVLIVPKFLGYSQYAVLSGSMEPNIHVGAIVYDKAFDETELEVDDVITYQLSAETLVTHRVVAIDNTALTVTTKGDANETEDGTPVPYSNIVGIYAFNIPYLGYISIYGKTPLGIAGICGILVVIILLNFLPEALSNDEDDSKSSKEKESEKEEKETDDLELK